jgi:small subunit ribosomal protein S18
MPPYRKPRRPLNAKCPFCEQKTEPNYKEYKGLRPFITEKGKIHARSRSGVCMKHQRILSAEVKRARLMALLPFVSTTRTR